LRLFAPFGLILQGPVLTGKRIVLRPPVMEDFSAWVSLREKSRSFLEPWEPLWSDSEFTRRNFRLRLRAYKSWAEADQAISLFIFKSSNGELLGGITLGNIRRGVQQSGTLGYWIGEPHKQQGYMAEAVNLIVDHCFTEMNLHRVDAACLPRNTASRALLKSCGFQEEGLATSYIKIAGAWEDHVLYAKVNRGT
jgi:ribosomal-protein-alanine N-acetyltransferase